MCRRSGPAGIEAIPSSQAHRRPGEGTEPAGAIYAALDLGTNNCRLLVARPSGHSFHVIDAFFADHPAGRGHLPRPAASARPRSTGRWGALSICRDKMRHRGVTRARLVATEARRAGGEWRRLPRPDRLARSGWSSKSSTGRPRRRWPRPAVPHWSIRDADGVILFDIGGGSSEIVRLAQSAPVAAHGPPHPEIRAWASLPFGVVTLAERHGGVAVTGRESYERRWCRRLPPT